MSKLLAKTVASRLRAGALVVIIQEPDEVLAVAAAKAGAGNPDNVKIMSAANQDVMSELENLCDGGGVLILSDFLAVYGLNLLAVRIIREVALQALVKDDGEAFSRLILIESPVTDIPLLLRSDVEVISPPLPSVEELTEELGLFVDSQEFDLKGNGEERYAIAGAVAGLARHEAARLFAMSWVENKNLDPGWLRKEKAKKVAEKLGGALTFEATLSADMGGMQNLKGWLGDRKKAFGSVKAKAFGLPEPKGLLLLGIPGGGKSLTAKTVAREWSLPLLRLDVGKVFGSFVGQSELQTRQAIEAAEACSPCVLWIDEIEKGLGSSGGGGDSGTSQRVFGTLLTWLQEKTKPVFVVATANRIADLPPELLRKGRFDEIFFVGLPTMKERIDIAEIHLTKRDRPKKHAKKIAEACSGFTGAEIEQSIVDGLFSAFAADRDLKLDDVVSAAKATAPISKTMSAEINAIRQWADGRARPASLPESSTDNKRRRGPALEG